MFKDTGESYRELSGGRRQQTGLCSSPAESASEGGALLLAQVTFMCLRSSLPGLQGHFCRIIPWWTHLNPRDSPSYRLRHGYPVPFRDASWYFPTPLQLGFPVQPPVLPI